MDIRPFDPEDIRAVERIWREVGWAESGGRSAHVKDFVDAGNCIVGCLDGVPECAVLTVPGSIRYLEDDLKLMCMWWGISDV